MVGCHGEADGDEFRKQVGGLLRLFFMSSIRDV